METYQFPFGRPHGPTPPQKPSGDADIFVVGVYPSALHAAWVGPEAWRGWVGTGRAVSARRRSRGFL